METESEAPSWTDGRRLDGALAVKSTEGLWLILTGDERPPLTSCPCCKKPFRTRCAAERVANAIYPADEQSGPSSLYPA